MTPLQRCGILTSNIEVNTKVQVRGAHLIHEKGGEKMFNILGKYEELAPGMGFPSMKSSLSKTSYPGKAQIIQHLKTGNVHMASAGRIIDVFTGQAVDGYGHKVFMDDGVFSWCSSLVYYVENV